MNETTKRSGQDTLDVMNDLRNQGIDSFSIIMRHSNRRYDLEGLQGEASFGLTNEGKELAYEFGKDLPTDSVMRLFSSFAARCIETAYLIEKGNIS
jgi:hypothetical protein